MLGLNLTRSHCLRRYCAGIATRQLNESDLAVSLSLVPCSAAFKPARANAPRRLATVRPRVSSRGARGLGAGGRGVRRSALVAGWCWTALCVYVAFIYINYF